MKSPLLILVPPIDVDGGTHSCPANDKTDSKLKKSYTVRMIDR